MTEKEWLAAKRPLKLLRYLHSAEVASDRKLRLFAVACCRRVAEQIPDMTLVEVIDGCEAVADNFALARLTDLRRMADRVSESIRSDSTEFDLERYEYSTAACQFTEYPIEPEHC